MKKFLVILMAILCIPISSFAMSLSTLQNNPDRYFKFSEDSQTAIYLDTQSVDSLLYNPPYYTLGSTAYIVSYSNNEIAEFSQIFNYNYAYSRESTLKRIITNIKQKVEFLDDNIINSKLDSTLKENSGIECSSVFLSAWTLNGKLFQSINTDQAFPKSTKVNYLTRGYIQAEIMFHLYYNQFF